MSNRARLVNYFRSRDRAWVLSLIVAACLLYLPFLGSPFIFDDYFFIMKGLGAKYAHSWFDFDLRWFPYFTLGWTEVVFSNVVTHFFHLGNLLLHAANVVLLFYLLRQLAGSVAPDDKRVVWGAWLGALIFAIHPVSVYATGYVVQRSILMAAFFALIMQLAYLRGLLTGQARWFVLAAATYFLAVFSKEHSVLTPALLAAETWLLRGQIRASRRPLWLVWAAFALVGLLIILVAKGTFGTPYEAMAADLFKQEGVVEGGFTLHLLSILTQMGLFFKYLMLWIVPNPAWMSIDMRVPFVSGLDAWQGWLGAAAFLAYGAIGVRLLWQRGAMGLLGLAMLYPWLQFMLEFSTIRVQETFVLYRSYLWMPGLMLGVVCLALALPQLSGKWRSKLPWLAGGVLVALLSAAAANRLWVMADPFRLWNDAALALPDEKAPGADRIYFNRGQAEAGMGKLEDAIADFKRSLALSPQYAPVHFELGWALARLNRFDEAMPEFDQSIALDPKFPNAYFGKGMILKMQGKPKEAAEQMEKACQLKVPTACLVLGKQVMNENK